MDTVKDRYEEPVHRENMINGEREPPHPHAMRERDKGKGREEKSSFHAPPEQARKRIGVNEQMSGH